MIPHPLGYSPASLPASWNSIVSAKILPTENVLGWMQVDLDAQLCFNPGILICTEGRLISIEKRAHGEFQTQLWDLRPELKVNYFDYAGVGNLELLDSDSKLVAWRFTLKYQQNASQITELVNLLCQSLALHPQAPISQDNESERLSQENRCPQCKALLDASGQCRSCQRQAAAPAVSWSLFRLWRFAKPYQWQLLSGFLLTLAATAATLVPPYLTMPLMDDVLIPFQNGQQIDIDKVSLYLMGLFGSALLAWGLGWAKT